VSLLGGCLHGIAVRDSGPAGLLFAAQCGVDGGAELAGGGSRPVDVGQSPAEEGDRRVDVVSGGPGPPAFSGVAVEGVCDVVAGPVCGVDASGLDGVADVSDVPVRGECG
jgi:hypothetical protein